VDYAWKSNPMDLPKHQKDQINSKKTIQHSGLKLTPVEKSLEM
jgi:hypothetical protein